MLKLSKLTDYAIVILSYMAKDYSTRQVMQEISQATSISQPTVSKILKILVKAGILTSVRGAKGGYLLAKLPKCITVATIIDALEGPIALTECSVSHKRCSQVADCKVQGNWGIINQRILELLESVTLADMAIPLKPAAKISIR